MKLIKVGCCGFPLSRSKYYENYVVVELQNTFYDLPSVDWCIKLREEAPNNFEFVVKAWQVLTHPHTSPTWRKMRRRIKGSLENYGYLKPTRENLEAFIEVLEVAKTLNSKLIVLQTPPSMVFNEESFNWVKSFFKETTGFLNNSVKLCWEPRGEWAQRLDALKSVVEDFGVIHVTDLLKATPIPNPHGLIYTRLHGLNGEVNYRYRYKHSDFEKMKNTLINIAFTEAYVMFNNVYMREDSMNFKEYLRNHSEFEVL